MLIRILKMFGSRFAELNKKNFEAAEEVQPFVANFGQDPLTCLK